MTQGREPAPCPACGSEGGPWQGREEDRDVGDYVCLSDDEYDVRAIDTDEQTEAVKAEMRERGITELDIYRGEGPDQIRTSLKLFA